jgi:hypothetical protein
MYFIIVGACILAALLCSLANAHVEFDIKYMYVSFSILIYLFFGLVTIWLRAKIVGHKLCRGYSEINMMLCAVVFWCWWVMLWIYLPTYLYLSSDGNVKS